MLQTNSEANYLAIRGNVNTRRSTSSQPVRSIGRWEPVCISLCNSKSGPVLLFRRVIQTGSHRSGRITAEIHQSGRWLPRARDGIWCAGHCSKSVPSLVQFRGPSDWLGPWNLTNNVLLQCSSVCSKTYSLGSVYVDLPVFGPKLTAQGPCAEQLEPRNWQIHIPSSVGLLLIEWHTR